MPSAGLIVIGTKKRFLEPKSGHRLEMSLSSLDTFALSALLFSKIPVLLDIWLTFWDQEKKSFQTHLRKETFLTSSQFSTGEKKWHWLTVFLTSQEMNRQKIGTDSEGGRSLSPRTTRKILQLLVTNRYTRPKERPIRKSRTSHDFDIPSWKTLIWWRSCCI